MRKLFVLCVIGLLVFTGCKEKETKQEKPNTTNDYIAITQNELIQNQVWSDLEIKDVYMAYNGYMTTYKATLLNKKEGNDIRYIKLTFYDHKEEKIITLYTSVDKTLKLNEEYHLIASSDIDLSIATKVEYQVIYNE